MYTRTKTTQPPTRLQVLIDRLRFVLGVVAIIAIAVTFVINNAENSDINNRITNAEPPCLRYGSQSPQCHESFQAAIDSITDFQLCELLSKRPELTGVTHADCQKIAREQHRRGTAVIGQSGAQSSPGSARGKPSTPPANSHSAEHNAHPVREHQISSSPDHPDGSGHEAPHAPSPPAPEDPAAPERPAPQPPENPVGPPAPPEDQSPEPAPQAPPSAIPPILEVNTPGLPAHVCVPGVASVNC